ncbi:MAG: NADAR family protein [Candidatus Thiodiazotropha taylori]
MKFRVVNKKLRDSLNRLSRLFTTTPIFYPVHPSDGGIKFFHRDRIDFPFLSNFYPANFELDGLNWPTVEHYYQAQKSDNHDYRLLIMNANTPGKAKRIGDSRINTPLINKSSWFRQHPESLRDDWTRVKVLVMTAAINAKFTQNPWLGELLRDTQPCELIEDSPNDNFWGIGSSEHGHNQLGEILMAVRDNLQGDSFIHNQVVRRPTSAHPRFYKTPEMEK